MLFWNAPLDRFLNYSGDLKGICFELWAILLLEGAPLLAECPSQSPHPQKTTGCWILHIYRAGKATHNLNLQSLGGFDYSQLQVPRFPWKQFFFFEGGPRMSTIPPDKKSTNEPLWFLVCFLFHLWSPEILVLDLAQPHATLKEKKPQRKFMWHQGSISADSPHVPPKKSIFTSFLRTDMSYNNTLAPLVSPPFHPKTWINQILVCFIQFKSRFCISFQLLANPSGSIVGESLTINSFSGLKIMLLQNSTLP